ncbi:MAG: isoprenylcysteine carboxylmethyltransferase family protein, partial [bacterium]|nr:isoprenylcysteine carboxylmethyltransferase family protein [bacterium]
MSRPTQERAPGLAWPVLKRIAVVLAFTALWCAVLFVAAGRLDWIRAWIYVALVLLSLALLAVVILTRNPELVAARGKRHEDTKSFDKVFGAIYGLMVFVVPVVVGLDAARFGWSSMPMGMILPGAVLHLLGLAWIAAAMAVNRNLETTVRIQHDRGHQVCSSGPYRMVRHPMYVGAILQNAGLPLVLGSLWAFVPVAVIVLLFVLRTALEDRTLREELAGYEE